MDKIKGITVYCASSNSIGEAYFSAARTLGSLIAKANIPLITGGGKTGLMGAVNAGAVEAGGETIGVIPQFMIERRWENRTLSRLEITAGMHPRKEMMAKLSRAAIALPGGIGTFEELFEIITWKQLGLYSGNIVILNTLGYYDSLIEMFRHSIRCGFMKPDHSGLFSVAETPEDALRLALEPVVPQTFSPKF